MDFFCAKDNRQTDASKGCLHPNDYCSHRQSCLIYFMEQERKREENRKKQSKDSHPDGREH